MQEFAFRARRYQRRLSDPVWFFHVVALFLSFCRAHVYTYVSIVCAHATMRQRHAGENGYMEAGRGQRQEHGRVGQVHE